MLKISPTVVLVFLQQFRRNLLLKCAYVEPRNRQKIAKTVYFDNSRSFKVIDVNTQKSSLPVLILSSVFVPICNHFHARQANSGKVTSLLKCPFFPSFEGTPVTRRHKILSRNTKDSNLSYGKNP